MADFATRTYDRKQRMIEVLFSIGIGAFGLASCDARALHVAGGACAAIVFAQLDGGSSTGPRSSVPPFQSPGRAGDLGWSPSTQPGIRAGACASKHGVCLVFASRPFARDRVPRQTAGYVGRLVGAGSARRCAGSLLDGASACCYSASDRLVAALSITRSSKALTQLTRTACRADEAQRVAVGLAPR